MSSSHKREFEPGRMASLGDGRVSALGKEYGRVSSSRSELSTIIFSGEESNSWQDQHLREIISHVVRFVAAV